MRINMTGDTALGTIIAMAPVDRNAAMDTVASNFGLTREDLGVDDNDGVSLPGFEQEGGLEDQGDGLDMGEGGDQRDQQFNQSDFEGERPQRRARDQFGREPQPRRGQQQQQQQQPQIPQSAGVRADARGNLVDPRNGQIVARAGKEARLYQAAVNTTRQFSQFREQAQARVTDVSNRLNRAVQIATELNTRLEAVQARDQQVQRLGITPQEQMEAMQMVAMSKTNPIQALKTILTRAAANGIDLQQLGIQGTGGMAALADVLRTEIDQRMQPLKQRTEAEQRQEQQRTQQERERQDAQSHVAGFFSQNPEAKQFLPAFDAVLQKHPGTSLGEIWASIKMNLMQRQMMQSQGDGGRTRRRGAPNGRSHLPSAPRSMMAPVNQTYDQIARDVMDEYGTR